MAVGCFGRALVCFLMVGQLDSVLLFPLAFVALVLSKGHAVAKSSLVPAVVRNDSELVEANSRLSLIAIVASLVGGLPAAGVVAVFDARGSLLMATVVFGVRRVPRDAHPRRARPRGPPETSEERAELSIPSIRFAGDRDGGHARVRRLPHLPARVPAEEAGIGSVGVRARARGERGGRALRRDRDAAPAARARGGVDPRRLAAGVGVRRAARGARRRDRRRDGDRVHRGGRRGGRPDRLRQPACTATARSTSAVARSPGSRPASSSHGWPARWCRWRCSTSSIAGSGFFMLALVLFFSGLSYVGRACAPGTSGAGRGPAPPAITEKPPELGAGDRRDCLTVDVELRAVTEDELDEFVLADGYGFGFRWGIDESAAWPRQEMERTVAAIADGDIVATGRNYTLELTMPGGAVVPTGGVSWISTRPFPPPARPAHAGDALPRRGEPRARRARVAAHRVRRRDLPALRLRGRDPGPDVRVPACRHRLPRCRSRTACGCAWWSPTSRDAIATALLERIRPTRTGCGVAPGRVVGRRMGVGGMDRRRSAGSTWSSRSTANRPATRSTRSTVHGARATPRRSSPSATCSRSPRRPSWRSGTSSRTSTRRSRCARGTAPSTTRCPWLLTDARARPRHQRA